MTTRYTREELLAMDEDDLGFVYQSVTNQPVPINAKKKDLIEEILAERQKKKSEETKLSPSLSPPVKSVRSTLLKTPKKAQAPIKQSVSVRPDVVSRGLIETEILEEKEKGTPLSPADLPQKPRRGRPPKSKKSLEESEERERSSSPDYGPPKSPETQPRSILESIAIQVKETKVVNPKASFQKAAIREKEPEFVTPIVVSDVNVSSVILPVEEEAKISISEFLSGIGFSGAVVPARVPARVPSRPPSPLPAPATIEEEPQRVEPPPSLPSKKPKYSEYVKEGKYEEEEPVPKKIPSKRITKVVSVEEPEPESKKVSRPKESPIKLTSKEPVRIEEVTEPVPSEKKIRRRATVVKRTEELEIPQTPTRVPSKPVEETIEEPVRVPSEPKKTSKLIEKISEISIPKKVPSAKKVSPKTAEKIEREFEDEDIDMPLIPKKKSIKTPAPKPPSPKSAEPKKVSPTEEELLDMPLIRKKKTIKTPAPKPPSPKSVSSEEDIPLVPRKKKVQKVAPESETSPVIVRRLTKTSEIKETSKGPKEVVKKIEAETEVVEEPETGEEAEEIFTRIQSAPSSKASSRTPSAPSSLRKTKETKDIRKILESVDQSKIGVGKSKNLYTLKDLENILISIDVAHTGKKEKLKKEKLVERLQNKLRDYGLLE